MGYNIQYRKTPGSKQTQIAFGPKPSKVMKALKMLKKGQGQGTSEEPIFFYIRVLIAISISSLNCFLMTSSSHPYNSR